MTLESMQNLAIIQLMNTTTGKYYKVQTTKHKLMLTKAFPNQTLDTITINRPFELLFTDRQT